MSRYVSSNGGLRQFARRVPKRSPVGGQADGTGTSRKPLMRISAVGPNRLSTQAVAVSLLAIAALVLAPHDARAQAAEPSTRTGVLEHAQAEKAKTLTPQQPEKFERLTARAEAMLTRGGNHWYPFFENSYSGGGFPFGAGYSWFIGPYKTLDVRGSITPSGYKRVEAEFLNPRIFKRRGTLSVIGGWREATEVPFYGLGDSQPENRVSYGFKQPHASGLLTVKPTRRLFFVSGGIEYTQWKLQRGKGAFPSVGSLFTSEDLAGIDAKVNYLHTQVGAGLDWRPAELYARRGGFYGVTVHEYDDSDDQFGFREVQYEAIQHIPILREAWVLSFRARVITSSAKTDQRVPFFMTPSLGSGSSLRAYPTRRFRGEDTLLLQGEWRIMVNRFMDTAIFYDTGKAVQDEDDLDFANLKSDVGFGVRFHGPFRTLLRADVANGSEGYRFIMSVRPVF
jgi:hypothetical protein